MGIGKRSDNQVSRVPVQCYIYQTTLPPDLVLKSPGKACMAARWKDV